MTIEELNREIIKVQSTYFPKHKLNPIFGGGRHSAPKFMFIFINPTIRNISTDSKWEGPIYPFIGTKNIWRIFHRAGLFDENLLYEINKNNYWSIDLSKRVLGFLNEQSFYITNIVKLAGYDASLPNSKLVKLYLPLLEQEIDIVKPRYIITFGLIPFNSLINESLKLNDYYNDMVGSNHLKIYNKVISGNIYPVIPSYFPIGRGNPKRAVEILKKLKNITD